MLNNIKKRNEGFTIIEVLIVLAIAGLILLVVFLAVPALQRNSRNTQRSNDVAGVLAAVTEYVNNNNGNTPTAIAVANGVVTFGTSGTDNQVTAKTGYYKTSGSVTLVTTAPTSATNSTDTNTMTIYVGGDCNTNGTQVIAGAARSIAAAYTNETSAKQCKAS
jgi:prepilin-type N-terminal cleavage/methylation domain-containing protein